MLRVLVESADRHVFWLARVLANSGLLSQQDAVPERSTAISRNPAGCLSSVFSRPRARCLPSRRCTVDECRARHAMATPWRTTLVHPAAISRAFVGLPRLAGSLEQSEHVGTRRTTKEVAPCKATSGDADRQDRGSTSSMSASLQRSAARPAGGVSGSSASPRKPVRPAAASCARPKSAAARPRAALLLVRAARRPSPGSSPPWPSTPTSCPAASACGSSFARSGCRRSRAACARPRSTAIACLSSSTSCRSWERCSCRT